MDTSEVPSLSPAQSSPVWFDRPRPAPREPISGTTSYDVVVIGAGLAGLLSGLLLARGGRSVAVLEARRTGDGTTGHTTGKVSLLQGTKLSRVLSTNPPATARKYVEASREGQAWLRRYCVDHEVEHRAAHATSYATTRTGELRARAELKAARIAGLDVTWTTETELPFQVRGAVRLEDQFQLHAMDLVSSLVTSLEAEGGRLFEGSRVESVDRAGDRVKVLTAAAKISARAVVVATNQPILDRGAFFARLKPQRSYAASLSSPWVPEGMHLSTDLESRSLRSVRTADGEEQLLIGGSGHTTGRGNPARRLDQLLSWAREEFPDSELRRVWSAQDQSPVSGLPYVGPILPGDHRILVATGFDKWGFTAAPAAALLLAKDVLGGEQPSWGAAMRSWTPREALGAGRAALFTTEVGFEMVCGHAAKALSKDDPPLCTHLGGVLSWNSTEESWDCPLHGSRFAADGTVLEGPATRPL